MSLKVGIVGLPNVGKSTLFNALLKKRVALSANYPFATVEPNIGVVGVPDARLEVLAEITQKEENAEQRPPLVPAVVEFVDIAGLVKGAATGEGLGNKFLAHIREVDAIVHVLRDFGDVSVVRAGSIDPESDRGVVETELQLADLEVAQKILDGAEKDRNNPDKETIVRVLKDFVEHLQRGETPGEINVPERLESWRKSLPFLTLKPVLYVRNVGERDAEGVEFRAESNTIEINAKLEEELADFDDTERKEYLESVGIKETGLDKLVRAAYELLGLISFLTAGTKEVRAWTIKKGTSAPQAAGVIHTDFEKKFIKADVVAYEDFISLGGWKKSRELGKVRSEGRDYIIKDGDVVEFKIGS